MNAKTPVKHILVVTHNIRTVQWLGFCLDKDSYRISLVPPETDLGRKLVGSPADMVILDDLSAPLCSCDVLADIRRISRVPVIVLVNRQRYKDPITFLDLGADDYVSVPFNFRELGSRVVALFRRCSWALMTDEADSGRYRLFDGYVLDTRLQILRDRHGHEVEMSGTDHRLLQMLLDSAGSVLGREMIARITGGRQCSPLDRFIDVQISRLRKRLGDSASQQTLIRTVRGRGYLLAVDVQETDRPVWL